MTGALEVIVIGLAVVFLTLGILALITYLTGLIVGRIQPAPEPEPPEPSGDDERERVAAIVAVLLREAG